MLNQTLIFVYIFLVLLIGYLSGRNQTGSDFMLANRKLGLFSFVSTIVASMVGGAFIVAYTAYIFEFGWGAFFGIIGLTLSYIIFAFVGVPLRRWAHEHDFHTISDYFEFKFDRQIRHIVAVVIAVLISFVLFRQFIAGTQVLSAVSGYSYETSLIISVVVIFTYLVLGGFRSVVRTDIFQYLILFFLIFVVGISIMNESALPIAALKQNSLPISTMVSFLVYGLLLLWTSSDIWQRIFAAKNDQVIRRGFGIASVCLLLIGMGISFIAFSAHHMYPNIDPAQAFVFGILNILPPEILGLGVILIFAAIMSSTDTFIFVLTTNITKDFILPLKKQSSSYTDDMLMKYSKICLIFVVLVPALVAYFFRDIIDMLLISGGLEMSLTPVIIASLKWNLHKKAVLFSIFSGLTYVTVWVILGRIEPETMLSSVLISSIALLISQQILKK